MLLEGLLEVYLALLFVPLAVLLVVLAGDLVVGKLKPEEAHVAVGVDASERISLHQLPPLWMPRWTSIILTEQLLKRT